MARKKIRGDCYLFAYCRGCCKKNKFVEGQRVSRVWRLPVMFQLVSPLKLFAPNSFNIDVHMAQENLSKTPVQILARRSQVKQENRRNSDHSRGLLRSNILPTDSVDKKRTPSLSGVTTSRQLLSEVADRFVGEKSMYATNVMQRKRGQTGMPRGAARLARSRPLRPPEGNWLLQWRLPMAAPSPQGKGCGQRHHNRWHCSETNTKKWLWFGDRWIDTAAKVVPSHPK